MADVSMPRLSDSMEEGTILKWLKSDGDEVKRGEELVEIETDKANMTYEADSDGTLTIVAKEGDTLPVGETIARLGDGSEPPEDTSADEEEMEAILDDAMAEIDDPTKQAALEKKLEKEFAREYHLITRDDRLESIAKDLVEHFLGRGFQGKAMVVCIDNLVKGAAGQAVQNFNVAFGFDERLGLN